MDGTGKGGGGRCPYREVGEGCGWLYPHVISVRGGSLMGPPCPAPFYLPYRGLVKVGSAPYRESAMKDSTR